MAICEWPNVFSMYLHQSNVSGDTSRGQPPARITRLGCIASAPTLYYILYGNMRNSDCSVMSSAANRLIGEDVQSRRRPLLGPSPG